MRHPGMLLHGIMSTIAEFYSRNLATEVAKGMTQKAIGRRHERARPHRVSERNVRARRASGAKSAPSSSILSEHR